MTAWKIHPEAPTDDAGQPIHPERGHRICAATKSDRTTPTSHGRERDDIPYCTLVAGWGVDGASTGKCSHHGGSGGGPEGEKNGNWKHGGFSKVLTKGLTDREKEAIEGVATALRSDDPDDQLEMIRLQAAEAWIRYRRSGDSRHLREYRQLLSEFNIVDNTDHVDIGVEGAFMQNLREAHDE